MKRFRSGCRQSRGAAAHGWEVLWGLQGAVLWFSGRCGEINRANNKSEILKMLEIHRFPTAEHRVTFWAPSQPHPHRRAALHRTQRSTQRCKTRSAFSRSTRWQGAPGSPAP